MRHDISEPSKICVLTLLLLALVSFAAAECGDGICADDDDWESCPADCPPPEDVLEAEEMIMSVEMLVNEGDPGYDTLEDARAAFDREDYEQATELAQSAWDEIPAPEEPGDGMSGLTVIFLLLLVATLVTAGYMYLTRKKRSDDEELMRRARSIR